MPLAAGARLGPYEVLSPLGAGGMGEVYRARDTRLDRTVALKVLPSAFAAEATLRARFEREAHAISALQHPHICTLHDVGEEDGQFYLVMEHIEGETLAQRLRKGPLPLRQVLEVATQIAEALDAAHKRGIVHRDLKPGNVMLTKTGVKLLDFGLARLKGHGERPIFGDSLASLPTAAAPLTGQGTILGTVPYMAPEQLEGEPTDARTDLWALGAVIYEMVTGRRAFEGTGQATLIGAILEREPAPLGTVQPLTPPSLERLVKRCLAKSPDDRWDSAHDVADELRWITQSGLAPVLAAASEAAHGRTWRLVGGGLVLAAVSSLLGGVSAWRLLRHSVPRPSVVRSLLDVRPAEEVGAGGTSSTCPTPGGSRTALAWTPDGRALVFVGRRAGVRQLYVRELDQDGARSLAGTDGAQVVSVSPDGEWAAFWADGAIRKVPLSGGPVAVVVGGIRPAPAGMAWGPSGEVFYSAADGAIWRASLERAPAAVTTRLEAEVSHSLPTLLPGERVLLYTVRKRDWTWADEAIVAQDLATGERSVLLRDAVDARYLPSGHLVFLRRGTLFAVAFDAARLKVRGSPVALTDQVSQALTSDNRSDVSGAGQFSVAPTGALSYVAGPVLPYPEAMLVAVDRLGQVNPLPAPVRSYSGAMDVSPDGRRLAVLTHDITETGLWLHDTVRGTLNRLTPEGEAFWPRWTPDGQRITFWWLSGGHWQLAWQRVDGTAPPEVLAPNYVGAPSSWSPDGKQLALVKDGDIWVATIEASKASIRQVTHTSQDECWPEFSPDGRWLAYGSNGSGRFEVYVQPWPGPGPREQVSLEGGGSPAWSPSGRELFFLSPYVDGRRQMMVADVRSGATTLNFGSARTLFDIPPTGLRFGCWPVRCYGVAADGRRFFVTRQPQAAPTPPVTHIHLVQNWLEELKARVPASAAH